MLSSGEPPLFSVVYDDDAVAVVNKAAGLVMHSDPHRPNRDADNLAKRLNAYYGGSLPQGEGPHRPGILHRLDKNTSGLLLVARNPASYARLKQTFHRHVARSYVGFVYGVPTALAGTIDAPIGKHKQHFRCSAVDHKKGKPAQTHYRVLNVLAGNTLAASMLRWTLKTGRTHQIRVHMAHIGYPVWEDHFYSGPRRGTESERHRDAVHRLTAQGITAPAIGRQALHADRLAFRHPRTGAYMLFTQPMPADMMTFLRALTTG